jgi:hypothetical protein
MFYSSEKKLRFADLNVGDFFVMEYEDNDKSEYCPVLEKISDTSYNIARCVHQLKRDNRVSKYGKRILKLSGSCSNSIIVKFVDKNEV